MLNVILAAILFTSIPADQAENAWDVVVYGGTAGGVAAAIQVARMGHTAVLIEPGEHLGGLTSGGLGMTDTGNKNSIGGISREFYQKIRQHYSRDQAWIYEPRDEYPQYTEDDTMWRFEPHVAEDILGDMIREAGVQVVFGERLDLRKGVEKEGQRIVTIAMESGRKFRGRVFIDATYEGDLMAKAGVSYAVGRESNETYGEKINGIQKRRAINHQFLLPVDPYLVSGDPSSGLLPGVQAEDPGEDGQGDHRIQAYCFRMCLTDSPENLLPFPRPEGYDPMRYELLLRYLEAGWREVFGNHKMMPNRKTDTNNHGAFSTDNIGMNYDYPEGDYETRRRIIEEHETYQKGLMWFLANDPRVPEELRSEVGSWGLAKDEFADNGNWPHQLYVREARRMVSDYVITENDCRGARMAPDSVGLGSYGMDSHNTQRYADEKGHVRNEGNVQSHGFPPYPVSYRSMVPKASECINLLVPVCVSASHIAYGSIRMEPVFMILGQSAGTAAVHAIEGNVDVQRISYDKLRGRLLEDGQIIKWTGKVRAMPAQLDHEELSGIIVDDTEAEMTGRWLFSAAMGPYVDLGYRHDDNADKGEKSARFQVELAGGHHELRLAYSAAPNRATNVPVTISHADGVHTVIVNQTESPTIDKAFVSLGTYRFTPDEPATVTISNRDTDGHVIIDAIHFVPVK